MKTLFWLLVAALLVAAGYLVYNVARARRQQAAPVAYEVGTDSIVVYQSRLELLRAAATRLRVRAAQAGPLDRLRLERDLDRLDAWIRDLSVAIEQWRAEKNQPAQAGLYQRCILMYGKASGVCDVLADDTLPLAPR
jgi:hypothetical protein